MKHSSMAWIAWVLAAAVVAMMARNPIYSLVLLLASAAVLRNHTSSEAVAPVPLRRFAMVILLVTALYSAAFIHIGRTVLVRLPGWPLVGGPITLEAIVAGMNNGLTLIVLLAVFMVLARVVPLSHVIRLVPSALADVSIVLMISVAFIPETRRHYLQIRDAQAVRGHQLNGIRDWQPIVIPLMMGGMERAMRLAETMTARGYASARGVENTPADRAILTAALGILLAGALVISWHGWPGYLLLVAGSILILMFVRYRGQTRKWTTYRRPAWQLEHVAALVVAMLALMVVATPLIGVDRSSLAYAPFPGLTSPEFDWWIGIAIAGLALPAFVRSRAGTAGEGA